jgi:hypothetical protein
VWWSSLVFLIWFPVLLLISVNANNFYRLSGQETALVRMDRALKSMGPGAMAPAIAFVVLGMFLAWRWRRKSSASGVPVRLAEEAITQNTAHRSFWSQPEVAALLAAPVRTDRKPPGSAREMAAAIAQALAGAGSELGEIEKAREAARQLTGMVVALDNQISALAGASDAVEVKRLTERLAALGPDLGPTDLNREVRGLLQAQLEAARQIESRIEAAKSRRSLCLDLLQTLWVQAVALRDSSREPTASRETAERLRTVLARIDGEAGGATTVGPTKTGAVEGLSDAPTIERS